MKAYSHYVHLLFDADDTLFDFTAAEDHAITKTFLHFGVEPSKEHKELYHTVNAGLWELFNRGDVSQEDLAHQRFRLLLDKLGVEGDAQGWNLYYRQALGSCSILLPGAESLCRKLSGRYTLSLITNGLGDVQRSRLKASPLERYFGERVFISGEMGCRKPEKVYFEKVLDALGCRKKSGQVLVIGDSLSSDIRGAFNAQLDSAWLNRKGERAYPVKPTYELSGYPDLEKLLLPSPFDNFDYLRT